MTTLVSLPTRDCIVIGCDSLATSSRTVLNTDRLLGAFFNQDGTLRVDSSGRPLLDSSRKLTAFVESLPSNQLPNVTKIFRIDDCNAGLLFAGIAGIGNKSVRNLVEEFTEDHLSENGRMTDVAEALANFLEGEFEDAFQGIPADFRPSMEILLSGYSHQARQPEIIRITVGPAPMHEGCVAFLGLEVGVWGW